MTAKGGTPKRHWTGRCEFPLTEEYEAGHVANFGKPKERFCKCGYLPAWCRCLEQVPDLETIAKRVRAAR